MNGITDMRLALIIGAMKSGTTSLFELLAQHPRIVACSEKEPGFFSHDEQWEAGLGRYRALWPERIPEDSWLLEASTHYTKPRKHPAVVDRIAETTEHIREARFIYIMRDPAARLVSHYAHLVRTGRVDPDEPLDEERLERMIDVSRYASQVRPFVLRFGRDRVRLLAFESLRDEPGRTLAGVGRFLEIDDSFQFRSLGAVHNPGVEDARVVRALSSSRALAPLRRLLPLGFKARLRAALGRRADRSGARMPDVLFEKAMARLQPEVRALREEFGFDTSAWPSVAGDQT